MIEPHFPFWWIGIIDIGILAVCALSVILGWGKAQLEGLTEENNP